MFWGHLFDGFLPLQDITQNRIQQDQELEDAVLSATGSTVGNASTWPEEVPDIGIEPTVLFLRWFCLTATVVT